MASSGDICDIMKAHTLAHHANWRSFDLETGMPEWKTKQARHLYDAICDDIDNHEPPTIREIVATAFKTAKMPDGPYLLSGAIKRD